MERLMHVEWLAFAGLLIFALVPIAWWFRRQGVWVWILTGVLLTLCGFAAASRSQKTIAKKEAAESLLEISPREGRPGGYVTSDACQSCHPEEYASWHRTYHRTMTQRATPENVIPELGRQTLVLKGETYLVERVGDAYWAEMPGTPEPAARDGVLSVRSRVRKRLTLLTGSHHMQVFWVAADRPNAQILFPFCYLLEEKRWVPFHSTFLRDPKMEDPFQVWNNNCINCHSTAGQPRPQSSALATADTRTGELGIGCESCHGPGERHVQANQKPLARYLHRTRSDPDPTIVHPGKLDPKASSQVCGQCHGIKWIPGSVDWKQEGFPYKPGDDLDKSTPVVRPARLDLQPWLEGAMKREPRFKEDRFWPDGIVRVSGRDFNGMLESACYQKGAMSCLSCHSMHHSDPKDMLAKSMETNEACLQCHGKYRENISGHTHHRQGSSGSECYNCHMPHTTYGLLKGIRNHFIESPRALTTLRAERPLACNLCHLDKSLGWSSKHLSAWYGQPLPRLTPDQESISHVVLASLRGDAGQRALMAWTLGWAPALAASGSDWQVPLLGQLLADPYSAVRHIAARSVRALPGFGAFEYDFVSAETNRQAAVEGLLGRWDALPQKKRGDRAILMTPSGEIDVENWSRLRSQRNEKSVDLQE